MINISSALSKGTVLKTENTEYEILSVMHISHYSIVYKAISNTLDRTVVIKELFSDKLVIREKNCVIDIKENKEYRYYKESFDREIDIMENLSTDSRCREFSSCIIEWLEKNNTKYIVMNFIEGASLRSYIEKENLSVLDVWKLWDPFISYLMLLQEKGIVHGDISPDNIIVTPTNCLMIIDYGASFYLNIKSDHPYLPTFTQGFSAPEKKTNRNIGFWSDVYSLAATIFFTITKSDWNADNYKLKKYCRPIRKSLAAGLNKDFSKRPETFKQLYTRLHRNIKYYQIFKIGVLACIVVAGVLIGNNYIANITELGKLVYQNNGSTITVVGADRGVTKLRIPATINSNPVTSISGIGPNVTELYIEEGISRLEAYAFENANYLRYISIPSSVTYIDPQAFINCTALKDIDISEKNSKYYMNDNTLRSKEDNSEIYMILK